MLDINIDPYILLSIVNTKLRNVYSTLDVFIEETSIDKSLLLKKLQSIGYKYNSVTNQFVSDEA